MKSIFLFILAASLLLTGCNFTGSATDVPINPDSPGIYIDGPDKVFIGPNYPNPLIEVSIQAHSYDNLTGFELDLAYSGPVTYSSSNPGGIFGLIPDTTYFCLEPQETSSSINGIACLALPDGEYPNTAGSGNLYNVSFIPNSGGTAVFTIDTTIEDTILADDSNNSLNLLANTATKTVLICADLDDDGAFSDLSCNGVYDCDDSLNYRHSNYYEYCNGLDNDCDGSFTDTPDCSSVTPEILSIDANSLNLYDGSSANPNPTLSGDITFSVGVEDHSLSPDGQTDLGPNLDRVDFYVDDVLQGSDSTSPYTYTYSSNPSDDGAPHSLRVVVHDSLSSLVIPVEVTRSFTVDNTIACEITNVYWDKASVDDGGDVMLTVEGSEDCRNKQFSLAGGTVSYLECDGASCEAVPANIANALPANTINFAGSTSFTESGKANWFVDIGDNNPQIKIVIDDDVGTPAESGLLTINNVAPDLLEFGSTPNVDSASVYMTVSEASTFTLEYGTAPGDYSWGDTYEVLSTSHTFDLTGLEPVTQYYYVITAYDQGGLPVSTNEQTFNTTTYTYDFDGNGAVDMLDLYEVVRYFRVRETDALWDAEQVSRYNLNSAQEQPGEGIINILDLSLMVRSFTG